MFDKLIINVILNGTRATLNLTEDVLLASTFISKCNACVTEHSNFKPYIHLSLLSYEMPISAVDIMNVINVHVEYVSNANGHCWVINKINRGYASVPVSVNKPHHNLEIAILYALHDVKMSVNSRDFIIMIMEAVRIIITGNSLNAGELIDNYLEIRQLLTNHESINAYRPSTPNQQMVGFGRYPDPNFSPMYTTENVPYSRHFQQCPIPNPFKNPHIPQSPLGKSTYERKTPIPKDASECFNVYFNEIIEDGTVFDTDDICLNGGLCLKHITLASCPDDAYVVDLVYRFNGCEFTITASYKGHTFFKSAGSTMKFSISDIVTEAIACMEEDLYRTIINDLETSGDVGVNGVVSQTENITDGDIEYAIYNVNNIKEIRKFNKLSGSNRTFVMKLADGNFYSVRFVVIPENATEVICIVKKHEENSTLRLCRISKDNEMLLKLLFLLLTSEKALDRFS